MLLHRLYLLMFTIRCVGPILLQARSPRQVYICSGTLYAKAMSAEPADASICCYWGHMDLTPCILQKDDL